MPFWLSTDDVQKIIQIRGRFELTRKKESQHFLRGGGGGGRDAWHNLRLYKIHNKVIAFYWGGGGGDVPCSLPQDLPMGVLKIEFRFFCVNLHNLNTQRKWHCRLVATWKIKNILVDQNLRGTYFFWYRDWKTMNVIDLDVSLIGRIHSQYVHECYNTLIKHMCNSKFLCSVYTVPWSIGSMS